MAASMKLFQFNRLVHKNTSLNCFRFIYTAINGTNCIKVGDTLPDITVYEHTPCNSVKIRDVFSDKKGILFSVPGAFSPGCSQGHIPEYLEMYDKFAINRLLSRMRRHGSLLNDDGDATHIAGKASSKMFRAICGNPQHLLTNLLPQRKDMGHYLRARGHSYVLPEKDMEGYSVLACVCVNDPFVLDAWAKEIDPKQKMRMLADVKGEFTKAIDMELENSIALLGNVRSKRYTLLVDNNCVTHINGEADNSGLACLLCIQRQKKASSSKEG